MFVYAVDLAQLENQKKIRVEVENKALLLTWHEGKPYAMADRCPHMGASLFKGTYEEGIVTCPAHGARFNVKTGSVIDKAKMGFVKIPTKNVATFKTKIEDQKIFVEL
jgi:3-phenylpropionate/trans-cinnamate dioxygenase ferredoxin component